MYGPDAAYYQRIARWSATARYAAELERLWREMGLAAGSRVLDLGCGTGTALAWMAARGARGVGVDRGVGWQALAVGPAVGADAASLPFPDGGFDAAILMHVVAHLADPLASLRETARVLRAGGVLGLVTPNRHFLTAIALARAHAPGYVPDPTVERHFRLGEVVALVAGAGFEVRQASRFGPAFPHLPIGPLRERILVVARKRE